MRNKDYEVMFVYSEIQMEEENTIASKTGKKYVPGSVFTGAEAKLYTKIIKPEQWSFMRAQYPDVKIVDQGMLTAFKYTESKKELI
jgi:hypothetical protein